MWVFLPIASLLIPVITGNLKINEDGLNSQSRFEKDRKNAFASRINQLDIIVPKTWSETILAAQEDENKSKLRTAALHITRLTINDNLNVIEDNRKNKYTQQIDSDMKIVSKRSKIGSIEPWLYNNNKNPLQKRKATFQPWGGKRVIFYKPIPTITQPIRMPFKKWYRKEGEEYLNLIIGPETKRSKFIDDATRQSESLGRYGNKRMITGGRTGRRVPFRSWGGKRSEEVADLDDEELMLVANNVATNDYDAKVPDIREIENVLDNKRAAEMDRNNHNRFHSWGGKRDFVYGTPLHSTTVNNETNNDFTTDEEADEINRFVVTAL